VDKENWKWRSAEKRQDLRAPFELPRADNGTYRLAEFSTADLNDFISAGTIDTDVVSTSYSTVFFRSSSQVQLNKTHKIPLPTDEGLSGLLRACFYGAETSFF